VAGELLPSFTLLASATDHHSLMQREQCGVQCVCTLVQVWGFPWLFLKQRRPLPWFFVLLKQCVQFVSSKKKAFSSTLDFELAERSFVFANRKWKPPKFVDSGDDFLYALSIWGSELALFLRLSPF
jgi:hypothetical protein